MQLVQADNDQIDLATFEDVALALGDYSPDDFTSPTDAALARGHARLINRDNANDDFAETVAQTA